MTDRSASLLREFRAAAIWAAFALGFLFATQPVWGSLLFGVQISAEDYLSIRCFGFTP
ncbi:hypothetical protein [Rhizobium sp. R339]|uniref:hypothetical protein n=1 Tax=Rhizobium sp. R339 TaxID=1764273 RepID=UPI00167CEC3D|nr:hypothetical protein [Rhizobium sp. R339]